jgi:hypothetical protein
MAALLFLLREWRRAGCQECPARGGAMAGDEEEKESRGVEGAAAQSSEESAGQEIDRAEGERKLHEAALKWLVKHADAIMKAAAERAMTGDDKALKMLIDWAFRVPAAESGAVPASFALELWEISKQLLAEGETQGSVNQNNVNQDNVVEGRVIQPNAM